MASGRASPLNGLRPLDPTRLETWRAEKHRARNQQILHELPKLPEYLIEMGYESDSSWVRDYHELPIRGTKGHCDGLDSDNESTCMTAADSDESPVNNGDGPGTFDPRTSERFP